MKTTDLPLDPKLAQNNLWNEQNHLKARTNPSKLRAHVRRHNTRITDIPLKEEVFTFLEYGCAAEVLWTGTMDLELYAQPASIRNAMRRYAID